MVLHRSVGRALRPVGALVAALATLAPAPAVAEGEGRKFTIRPSLRVATVLDDNVFLTDDDREKDAGFWIAPRLELGYRGRSFEVGVDGSADIRRYTQNQRLDDELYRVHAFAETGVLPGLTLHVANTYLPQPVTLGLPEDETENLVQTNRTLAKITYWRELPGGREIEVGVQGSRLFTEGFQSAYPDSDGNIVVDDSFNANYWETAAYAEVESPIGKRMSAFVRGQFRYRMFDESSELDLMDGSGLVGFRTRWFKALEFVVAGGYGVIDFKGQGSTQRFLGRGELRYRLPSGWSTRLGAFSKFTADLRGNDFVETTGRLGVEKRIGERTGIGVSGFVTHYDSDSWSDGSNLFGGVEANLRRQLTRRLQGAITYRHWRNGGDREVDDFNQNRLMLVLSYRH